MKRLLVIFCLSTQLQALVIEWVVSNNSNPPSSYLEPIRDIDKDGGLFHRLRYYLAKEGHTLVAKKRTECGQGDIILFTNICSLKTLKRIQILNKPTILFNFEPPINDPLSLKKKYLNQFTYILTWNDSLVDDKKFRRMYYPSKANQFKTLPAFSERKLCCLINTNLFSKKKNELYSSRLKIAEFYDQMENGTAFFDLFGKKWDSVVSFLKPSEPKDKLNTLKNYRFCYAYENWSNSVSYITEKIFDCFTTGTIPIYLGSTTITSYVPKNCFIDARDFSSIAEIHNHILQMDEKTWQEYQKNIRLFLASKKSAFFTNDYFIQEFIKLMTDIKGGLS